MTADNDAKPGVGDTPGCFQCSKGTVPVTDPTGTIVAGYCDDCNVVTGRHGGCAGL